LSLPASADDAHSLTYPARQPLSWYADHSSLLTDLRAKYTLAALHGDPPFRGLLKRMNLPA